MTSSDLPTLDQIQRIARAIGENEFHSWDDLEPDAQGRCVDAAVRALAALAEAGYVLAHTAGDAKHCHCNGLPYPDLSRLSEMTGYLEQLASETGDDGPAELWREIRSSINRPIREHIRKVQREIGAEIDGAEAGDA